MPRKLRVCGTCRYLSREGYPVEVLEGTCRRGPPLPVRDGNSLVSNYFLPVGTGQWCGEWRASLWEFFKRIFVGR